MSDNAKQAMEMFEAEMAELEKQENDFEDSKSPATEMAPDPAWDLFPDRYDSKYQEIVGPGKMYSEEEHASAVQRVQHRHRVIQEAATLYPLALAEYDRLARKHGVTEEHRVKRVRVANMALAMVGDLWIGMLAAEHEY